MNSNNNNNRLSKLFTLVILYQFLPTLPLLSEPISAKEKQVEKSEVNKNKGLDSLKVENVNEDSEINWDLINIRDSIKDPSLIWAPLDSHENKNDQKIYWENSDEKYIK